MTTAEYYQVTEEAMKGKSRKVPLPEARYMEWFILYMNGESPVSIAAKFDRDRTTIIYGVKKIAGLLSIDKYLHDFYINNYNAKKKKDLQKQQSDAKSEGSIQSE